MLIPNSQAARYQRANATRNLLCFVFSLCIVFAGCKSNHKSQGIPPEPAPHVSENPHSPSGGEDFSEQLYRANADFARANNKLTRPASVAAAPQAFTDTAILSQMDITAMADRSVARPLEAGAALAGIATVGDAAPEISSAVSVDMPAIDSPEMADQLVSLNFDKVDINAVLKTIGDITGINFVVDKSVSGPVTVMSPTKIRLGDVYTVLESILDVQGYAAVPSGDLVKIVPKAQAAKRSLQVRIGSDPEQMPDTDSVVTQIIPLSYADAAEVAGIVKPFAAAESQIATYPRTNSIVVTDTSSNIRYLTTIIHRLDVPGSKEAALVIPLKYASAQVLSEQILQIMDERSTAAGQSSRNRTQQGDTAMKILADDRTNSLIIVAAPQDIDTIRGLVEQLDVQRPIGSNNVHVVYLQNAQSKEVAQSLTAALTNLRISGAIEASKPVQVTSDEGTNAVIISASAQDFEVIGEIIEKLDIVREQVLVEMQIIEVSEDSLKEIGVDWASLDQSVDGSVRVFGATGFGLRSGFASGTLEGLALGAWRGAGTNRQIGTILHALQKVSGVNILSTPHILTSNHQKAMIVVGENRPFVMQSRITETGDLITPTVIKTYEYKDVGISLEITPHISQGGLIRLEVDTEFTKLIDDVTTTSTDTPATAKRQAQTVISMDSGSTVVIGGLIRDDITNIKKKVPLLGDIPVVGSLFRFRRDKLQKTNLLLFITPYRLGNQLDLEKITNKKKDEMAPVLEENQKKDETGRK